jgi:class 3 adenylate cyclase
MRLSVLLALAFAGVAAVALALAAGIAHMQLSQEVPVLVDQLYIGKTTAAGAGTIAAPGAGSTSAIAAPVATPGLATPAAIATVLTKDSALAGGQAAGTLDGESHTLLRYGPPPNERLLDPITETLWRAGLIAGIFAVALGLLIAWRMSRVLGQLTTAIRRLEGGDFSQRAPVGGPVEIATLARAFNAMAAALQDATHRQEETLAALDQERGRTERLLHTILPAPVALRLAQNQRPIADHFPAVTVLFADIVNFTALSSSLTPEATVAWLDTLFSAFDRLAAVHGVEKIKTIGDAYMAVAGMPHPREDHAAVMADFALALQCEIARRPAPNGETVQLRIGLHSGSVVAGVIGTDKFIYDLWGDVVNTASRMESHGIGGAIQISEVTQAHLPPAYRLEARGPIAVKGKGEMSTFWLRERMMPALGAVAEQAA